MGVKKNCGCGQDPCVTYGAEKHDVCEDSHLDGIDFVEWSEEAEGSDCYITGLPNPDGDIEGEDNICEPCSSKWIYDEGPEGEGYYRVSAMKAETFNDVCEDSHLDGIDFLEWTEYAEGPNCYITGLPNPGGDIEGHDNICQPCAAKWIYDEGGSEGEGYYRVSAMKAETFNDERRIYNINWDTDGEIIPEDGEGNELPQSVLVPSELEEDEIADYLSDKYGWKVLGFVHGRPLRSVTFEAMGWHDSRWAGDREAVEAKFKTMYPTYTIEEDSIDYLVFSGGASNKYHVFFLATDPAGNYHSFNAYGRIGYSPTLHHNAGPGGKSFITQAVSKKRYQKTKKGYVQQAEGEDGKMYCDKCDNLADYNFQDIDVRWDLDDGEFTSNYEMKNHLGNYNDFLCLSCAEKEGMAAEDFWAAEESFAYRVLDNLLTEPEDFEKVELVKPIRTGWNLGAGITLFSLSLGLFGVLVANLMGLETNGDE
jgi:hypothetical protein